MVVRLDNYDKLTRKDQNCTSNVIVLSYQQKPIQLGHALFSICPLAYLGLYHVYNMEFWIITWIKSTSHVNMLMPIAVCLFPLQYPRLYIDHNRIPTLQFLRVVLQCSRQQIVGLGRCWKHTIVYTSYKILYSLN